MSNRIRTRDAQTAMREVIQENVRSAADGNTLVSRTEAKKLDPFIKKAEEALRTEGGPGTRVSVDALVDRAAADANRVWEQFNPAGRGTDSTFLAKDEVAQVKKADPQLGALTELALVRAGKRGQDPSAVVRDYFTRFNFSRAFHQGGLQGGARLDVRPGRPERADVPDAVLKAFDFYYPAEASDWATVSLQRSKVAGQDVYAIYMTTDGDDAYLEVFSNAGAPLASARLNADKLIGWDEFFGRARLSPTFLNLGDVQVTEGYSEPAERAAAGQIPLDWPGDVALRKGGVQHRDGFFTSLDLAGDTRLTSEQRDLAYAAMDLVWERTLRHRVHGEEPLLLGPQHQGELRLGNFTNPVDGKHYLVADWKDIDDASHTFYYQRTERGLELAIEQFNN